MKEVKIKVINRSKFGLPKYQTSLSAGMDLHANIDEVIEIPAQGRALIPTGIYMALPEGYEAQVRPRSGLAIKKGITVLNSPGTVDADYRGEVCVILLNASNYLFKVNPGERIAQLVINEVPKAVFEEVESLDDTDRSSNGFGHTGVN